MSRHHPSSEDPYDFLGEVIRIEATNFAHRHRVDADRVQRILTRTATDYYGRPIRTPEPGVDNLSEGLVFAPSLEEALAYLPSEVALSVFERTDPVTLSKRVDLIPYLTDPTSPFYTVSELADLLDAFTQHLDSNRDSLIQTGYPATGFTPSPWLEWHLTLLSPTRLPVGALSLPDRMWSAQVDFASPQMQPLEPSDQQGFPSSNRDTTLLYGHAWSREAIPPIWRKDGPFLVRSLDHHIPIERCVYQEAALMHGLLPEMAVRLEDDRANLFGLKQDVIMTCTRCLRSGDVNALWPSVVKILGDTLLYSCAQRYLEVEEVYWQAGVGLCVVPSYQMRTPTQVPGTLSMLLTIVGHVEKELRLGTLNNTKSTIHAVLHDLGLRNIESYFEVVGHPDQAAIDVVLDGFSELEVQERSFWEEYRRRVNAALETELREEVVVRVPVKREHVAKFQPYVQSFAEWQRVQLEATGSLSPLQLSSLFEPSAPASNVFRLDGQVWSIEYDRKIIRLKDSKGLRYLAILLAHPHREFHTVELVRMVAGTPTNPDGPRM